MCEPSEDNYDVNVAGEYNAKTRVLTLNTKSTPSNRAHTVLHEIGHALFSNDMYGEVYLENLKLYNNGKAQSNTTQIVASKKNTLHY